MYDLIQVGEHTYYIASPTNVGVYEYGGHCSLIDSGSDKDAAKKIIKIIEERGWTLDKVFCTHSHADHTGGAATLSERMGCEIFAPGVCAQILRYPYLEPTSLFGGFPTKEMRTKFVMAKPCPCREFIADELPEGMDFAELSGHDFEQIGFKTSDGVFFAADSVVSSATVEKYKIAFLYDIAEYMKSLERLKTIDAKLFIPSHCEPLESISELADRNIANVYEVAGVIKEFCKNGLSIDELIEKVFEKFGIKLYIMQYELIGSTVRSYLSWLNSAGEITPVFEGSKLLWKTS